MYFVTKGNKQQCLLCPHECEIAIGEVGRCLARKNVGDRIECSQNGLVAMAVEPIEKKPFYHYLPGAKTLSVGFYGCNMSCDFCQNWKISQQQSNGKVFRKDEIITSALEKKAQAICFTYNEPTVWFENLLGFKNDGFPLKIILKSNGMLDGDPWNFLFDHFDAMNIDWKGTPDRVKNMAGVAFDALPNIYGSISSGKHVEISVPVYPDSTVREYEYLANFIKIYPRVPIHLLKIYPAYKMRLADTTNDRLIDEVKALFAQRSLYVYTENSRDTVCPKCKTINIKREGCVIKSKAFLSSCDECQSLSKKLMDDLWPVATA